MSVGNGSADLETLGVEWQDQQLERVRAVFDSVDSSVADEVLRENVLAEVPDRNEDLVTGVVVFRDLLRIEHRQDRFRRLLRIWAGKVTSGVRDRDYGDAGLWYRALVDAPVFPEEFAHLVAEARRDLSHPDLLDDLAIGMAETEHPSAAGPLLAAWGEPLVDYLVAQIVTDEPVVNRRHIVDLLGMAGHGDVRHLTARLADPRWFVVRNLVIAIGKSGRSSAVSALESVWHHDDDRVRVEVLRSIAALRGNESLPLVLESLSDPSAAVRGAALSIVRATPSEEVVPGVLDVLESGAVPADEARRLVETIGERRGPAVRDALERLAGRRFVFGAAKVAREAAAAALMGVSDE